MPAAPTPETCVEETDMNLRRFPKSRLLHSLRKPPYRWENYGRIRFVSDRIKELPLNGPKVLDAGGATGNNLLRKFGIEDVTTLDLHASADIVSSAADMPVEDGAFDVATCIDTLEHIPQELRIKVVEELLRVASKAVFVVAPLDSPENNQAEELVLKYTRSRFLEEHREHGLVDFDALEALLPPLVEEGRVARYDRHELDCLLNWVLSMTRSDISADRIYPEAYFLENAFCPRRVALCVYKA
jgi:hypothetical protein